MFDNTSQNVQISFDPSMRGRVSDHLVQKFFSNYNFDNEQANFITKEFGEPTEVFLKDVIGQVKGINWTEQGFVIDVRLFPTDYKRFALELIENKMVNLGWSIAGKTQKEEDKFAQYCYFSNYKQYKVTSIERLYYFFLKKP